MNSNAFLPSVGTQPEKTGSSANVEPRTRGGIGVIGGSGIYHLEDLKNTSLEEFDTPFGPPSSPILCGNYFDQDVFFIARHGLHHTLLPSEINYRANIFALKELGVEWCISIGAGGSLRDQCRFGDLVIPDQIIDHTKNRPHTFFGEGICGHVPFTEPYCRVLRRALIKAAHEVAHEQRFTCHDDGVYCCVEGPSHLTRAESVMMRGWGGGIVGMTSMPEARLAREAEISYASMVMITDYDIWDEEGRQGLPSTEQIVRILHNRVGNTKEIVLRTIERLASLRPDPSVKHALDGAIVTNLKSIPEETKEALYPILRRFI